jgi:hypothetical protein
MTIMSSYIRRIGLLFLLVACSVRAQNCPSGMVPEGGQGVASCRPVDSGQPAGRWLDQWGAIATDPPHHSAGASLNQSNEEQAKQAAIANCKSNGGEQCTVAATYANSCIAMVQGDTGSNIDRATSLDGAIKLGMDICNKAGDTNCHAYYSACSKAKWVQ